jgi:AraC-like DNA-binding protein
MVDARVQAAMDWAVAHLDHGPTVSQAADRVGLSADRMSHLFVEQTGLPFRTYLLWLRMSNAVEAYAAGRSLTDAAHAAGFADSSHFSRTFRRMFGVAAAELRLM